MERASHLRIWLPVAASALLLWAGHADDARALPLVGPGTTTICHRSSSSPFIDLNVSDASVPLVLRSKSEGGFLSGQQSLAFQGFGFIPLVDADLSITVPGVMFNGLLAALGAGGVNHADVRIVAVLTAGGDELTVDVIHERNHTEGGPSADDNLFNPVDGELEHAVEGGEPHAVTVRLETEAFGVSAQADFLTGAEQGVGGRRVEFGCIVVESDIADADDDGIPDVWEESGFGELDLPAMGATADHKDIFLEIDWLPGRAPSQAAVRAVREAFAAAPLSNPDGTDGVRLHVDTGNLSDPAAGEDGEGPGSCGDGTDNQGDGDADNEDSDCLVGDPVFSTLGDGAGLGDGREIPLADLPNGAGLPDLEGDLDGNERADFYEVRAQHFDLDFRFLAFHYAISAEDLTVGGGQAELGGSSIILGTTRASTLMHELGHNLRLQHGGDEGDLVPDEAGEEGNCKPNYVSIMNYLHSSAGGIPGRGAASGQDLDGDGVADGKIVDFSPPRFANGGRGQAPLPTLREDALDDGLVLDPSDPDNRFIFVGPDGLQVMRELDAAADWNSGEGEVSPVNINTSDADGSPAACTNDRLNDELTGFHDWDNLVLGVQGVGDPVEGPFNPTTVPEPTDEEIDAFVIRLNTTDLGIVKSHEPALAVAGQPVVYALTVTNHGPNPARDVRVVDTLPPGVTAVELPPECSEGPPGTVTCGLGELAFGETAELELEVRMPADLACNGGQRTVLTHTAEVSNLAGPDSVPGNNLARDRIEVLCIRYEYAAKLICGVQADPEDLRLAPGLYATSINIHNPHDGDIAFFKKLALAYPPAEQRAGDVIPIGVDTLAYDEALKTDCNELSGRVADAVAADTAYFEGFVVVQSPVSLDVTGVYTTAAVDESGRPAGHSSIDVEAVPERERERQTDLAVVKRASTQGETSPRIRYSVAISNEGSVAAEDIVVTDVLELSAGTVTALPEDEFHATHGAGWVVQSSGPNGAELRAEIASLAPGESAVLAFDVIALTDIQAGRTHAVNSVIVESATPDAAAANNRFVLETVIELP
ncbi:MAG: hypothetical protein ACREVI_03480 [Steroidobacteraceae bacterium]